MVELFHLYFLQAPDLADVIAPGVPREEIVRQQRYIEEVNAS